MKKIFASLLTVVTLSAVATGLALSADEKDVSSEYTVIRLSADDTDNGSESKSGDSEPGVVKLGPTEEPSGQIYVDPTNNGNGPGQFSDVYYEPGPAGRSVLRSQGRNRFDIDYFVDARGGGLQGYDHGYTALGALITEPLDEERLFFIDGRLNITNNSRLASNLGLGYRKYHPNQDRTSSISGWWDWDNGASKPHQQVGLSYSSISRYFRMNANGYLVMGNDSSTIYSTPQGDPFFQNSNIKQTLFQQNEVAYSGADLEVGGPMPLLGKYGVDWFVGPYYYSGGGEAAVGAKGRFNFQVNRDWEMGVTVASDDTFGTTAQINVELHLPDGHSGRWFRQRPIYEYLYQPTERNYRVNTRRLVSLPTIDLLNIKDGTALKVAHITPSAIAGTDAGDGTFEDPFTSTEAYEAAGAMRTMYDIILVDGGDGSGTNLDTGIEIFERQRLLSKSVTHDFRYQLVPMGPTLTTMLPTTGTGLTPILSRTDANGPVVTITPGAIDHCELTEVSGFSIDGTPPGGALNVGISGMGISGYNINRNTFDNVSRAVDITNDTNADPDRNFGLLVDNTVNGSGLLSDFGFNIINTDTGNEDLPIGMFVSNNTVDNISGTAINLVATDGADVVANDLTNTTQPLGIIDNTVTNSGTGIRIESNDTGGASTFISDFQNNSATAGTDAAGAGFEFIATGAGSNTQFNSFTGNTADNNLGNGAYVQATDSGTVIFADLAGTFDTFNNNSFDGNGVDGFANVANTSGSITFANIGNPLNTASNSFDGNTGNGFSSLVTGPATFTVTNPVVNNTFSGNGDNGFISTTTGVGAVSMFQLGDPNSALGNTFSNNGATTMTGRGVALNVDSGGNLMTSGLFNNTIEMNTLDGVLLSVDGAASAANDFSIINNLVNANMGNGVAVDLNNATMVDNLDISDNIISANGTIAVPADGVNINLVSSTLDGATIESNTIDANLDDGVNINIDDSEVTGLVFLTNTISNQVNGHGINIIQTSMTNNTLEVDFLDNEILDNTAGAGINVELMGAIQTTNVLGNTITGNGLQGINELLDLDSMLTLTDVSGNTISNNGGIGLQITANDTSMFTATVGTTDPNVFDANTDAGIGIEMFDTSSGSINVVNTTITNTTDDAGTTNFAGDGIGIRGNDGSTLTSVVIEDEAITGTRNVALNNNAGNGFFMMLQDDAVANVVTIDNIDALENTLNGLAFERQGNSDFQDVNIMNSTISDNTLDGIDIMTVGGDVTTSMFDITGNILDGNLVHGIDQFVSGTSVTNVNIMDNMITNSGMNGINAEGDFFGQLTGTYDTNFIDLSGQHGIALLATRDTPDFGLGTARNVLLTINNNMVMRSTMDGLNVVSNVRDAGTTADIEVDFTNNVLSLNMNNGATINANNRGEILFNTFNDNMILDSTNVGLSVVTNGEIDPTFVTNSSSITLTEVARNDILRSGGDGVFLNTTNPLTGPPSVSSVGTITANFIDNDVSFNGGNGFTLLNQFTSDMNVSIAGTNVVTGGANGIGANSRVSNNGGIGVLVENNAMSRFTDNDMTIAISNTAVVSNGLDATLTMDERHGIFLRVGTTGGFTSSDDPDIDLTFSRLEQVGIGGIFSADIQDNYLAGNGGIDFASESFVAGTDPTAASSNGASLFNLDPLAYLILNLTGNEGDSIDLTRAGATYNNADELKSNELLFNANNVAGGSAGETRVRNAQRLADNVTFDDHGRLVLAGFVDDNPAPAENVAGDTTTFDGNPNGAFPNVATNPADNEEFFFASVFFLDGVNAGVRENIRNYNNDTITTRNFAAGIPAAGDNFYIDVYNIAGIGTSTFRTTDADGDVNTGNAFTNVISNFTTQIDIGPQTGVGANDSTVEGTNQTFTWGIGDIFGSSFESLIP